MGLSPENQAILTAMGVGRVRESITLNLVMSACRSDGIHIGLEKGRAVAEALSTAEAALVSQTALVRRQGERIDALEDICREVAALESDDGGRSFPSKGLCANARAALANPTPDKE